MAMARVMRLCGASWKGIQIVSAVVINAKTTIDVPLAINVRHRVMKAKSSSTDSMYVRCFIDHVPLGWGSFIAA
jgi:hypothetical protein